MPRVVCVSGGFDPIHIGHVRLIRAAHMLGHWVHVIVNNDNWLLKKKGFVFMPEHERIEIVRALSGCDEASLTDHGINPSDMSVCRALAKIHPDVFANGGDRRDMTDIPEAPVCGALGIELVFNVGGGKVQSSSALTGAIHEANREAVGAHVAAVANSAHLGEGDPRRREIADEPATSFASLRTAHRA